MIIAACQDAGSYRGAAAICGTTLKTVKRVIKRAEAGDPPRARKERARNFEVVFEVVTDLVAERVKKSAGRITAKAVAGTPSDLVAGRDPTL